MASDWIGNSIAACVIRTFEALPNKAKPRTYPGGSQEWVPMCGIVMHIGGSEHEEELDDVLEKEKFESSLHCVSLGTGMKCLPAAKVSLANGRCLHDWHAEIVAIRAFNLFLLQECEALCNMGCTSPFLHHIPAENRSLSEPQPFAIKNNVDIYLYCSEAPCGDASMELTMMFQEDATPWEHSPVLGQKSGLKGRGYFSELGIVRRKPSRPDAPESLSKSCSDKLALKQCTSLLSSVTSILVQPRSAYLHCLILPENQYVDMAIQRAFSPQGRMKSLVSHETSLHTWEAGYAYRPFQVRTTNKDFSYQRSSSNGQTTTGSNITAIWTERRQEVLIGGTVQGFKQFSERGSSVICKARLWEYAVAVTRKSGNSTALACVEQHVYQDVKKAPILEHRARVKREVRAEALQNWVCNDSDEKFSLRQQDKCSDLNKGRRHRV